MKKLKLFSLLATFALCLCTLGIGVWAARQASFTSSGNITFNAINVEAEVTGVIKNAGKVTPEGGEAVTTTNYTGIKTLTYGPSATPTASDLASWKNNIEFDTNGTAFTLEITVTNKSSTRDICVYIHDNIDFTYNLKKEIIGETGHEGHARIIEASADVQTFNSETFKIQFRPYSLCANVGDGENVPGYDFTVNIYDEGMIASYDAEDENIAYERIETTNTAKVTGFKEGVETTILHIKPFIKINDTVCVVTTVVEEAFVTMSIDLNRDVYLPYSLVSVGSMSFVYWTYGVTLPYSLDLGAVAEDNMGIAYIDTETGGSDLYCGDKYVVDVVPGVLESFGWACKDGDMWEEIGVSTAEGTYYWRGACVAAYLKDQINPELTVEENGLWLRVTGNLDLPLFA